MTINEGKFSRKAVTDGLLNTMKQCITIEQYDRAKSYLDGLSDKEFEQFTAEMIYVAGQQKTLTPREYAEVMDRLRKANNVTDENTAMKRFPVAYLTDGENTGLWRDICRTRPSDHIFLKTKDDEALCELWKKGRSLKPGRIPSDLFFAGKVALHDCRIIVDETDQPGGLVCEYRVVTFSDYRERIKGSVSGSAYVGAVVMEQGNRSTFIPITVTEGVDYIGIGAVGHHNIPQAQIEASKRTATMDDIMHMAYAYMATWYGIQIALLHPTVQEVFRHPKTERVFSGEPKAQGKRKRVTRYVKKHVINADEVRNAAGGTGQEYTRHTLVWYVIGHWRNYANGKKVFIQPYWKGALRHLKMDLDGREREIIIQEEQD